MDPQPSILWIVDWAVSIPLIVLTLIIHVVGLGLIVDFVFRTVRRVLGSRPFMVMFTVLMTTTAVLVVVLHGLEGGLWATAYLGIGALPDPKSAMLYSLNAMTSYGHESQTLEGRWRLLGALESLNGMILFGLTTAFLFHIFQAIWSFGRRTWHLAPASSERAGSRHAPPDPRP